MPALRLTLIGHEACVRHCVTVSVKSYVKGIVRPE